MTENSAAVVGGGILGVAVARQLQKARPGTAVTLYEPRPSAATDP